jgi:hypothetical protein
MRRDTFKLLIFAGIVGFAILYGMELSSKGIETVNGPWETVSPSDGGQSAAAEGDWTLPPNQTRDGERQNANPVDSPDYQWEEEEYAIPRNDREPLVDRVSGKTAEVLHDLSRNGIRMVVSIFDKVMG